MIRSLAGRFRDSTSGAAAVEFAFVAMPLMLLIFGILEFGRALWDHNALQETAMAAARCEGISQGSLASTAACNGTSVTAYTQQVASGWGITVPSSGITATASTSCGGVTGFSQVSLTYTFQSAVPQLLGVFSGGVPLTATACFPIQP
ncbi:MAG TPA: TadE/TadG family type IV pilus assembly protein [Caulobacteraceae bacterium]